MLRLVVVKQGIFNRKMSILDLFRGSWILFQRV